MKPNASDRLQGLLTVVVWAMVTAYAVAFVWLNRASEDVGLTFWWGVEPRPRSTVLVVLAGFLVGFLVTALLAAAGALRRGAEERLLRRRIRSLEQELQRLRNLPIEEDLHSPPEPDPEPVDTERSTLG